MKSNLLIIVPVYNEAESIQRTIQNLREFAPEFDYVIVNDGSLDRTLEICKENNYHMLNLLVNVGLTHAVKAGMMYAYENGYDYALQFDGDGQHDARWIAPLYQAVRSGVCDIAIGSRYLLAKPKLTMRVLGSRFLSLLVRISAGQRLTDPTSGMRLYNRSMIGLFSKAVNINPEPDTISYLIHCGVRVTEIPVEMGERTTGESMFATLSPLDYIIRIAFSLCFMQWFRKKEIPL